MLKRYADDRRERKILCRYWAQHVRALQYGTGRLKESIHRHVPDVELMIHQTIGNIDTDVKKLAKQLYIFSLQNEMAGKQSGRKLFLE